MNQTRTIRLPIHIVKELNVYLRTARELPTSWIMNRALKRLPSNSTSRWMTSAACCV
ncbi:hypothetical protein M8494_22920 [Serratia ureilytica]